MKKTSSKNIDMIDALENIKKVPVRESLYTEIVQKLNNQSVIPIYKLRAAAAVFLCLVTVEFFLGMQNLKSDPVSEIQSLVPNSSNSFYYDQN